MRYLLVQPYDDGPRRLELAAVVAEFDSPDAAFDLLEWYATRMRDQGSPHDYLQMFVVDERRQLTAGTRGARRSGLRSRQRAAALLEVLGVYAVGQFVTGQIIRLLALQPANPLTQLTVDVTDAELISATWQLSVLLTLQYVGWFVLIIPINYWHRRRGSGRLRARTRRALMDSAGDRRRSGGGVATEVAGII